MTQQVMEVAAALGIALLDHIIVGRDGHVSFRERGLI
jgi:DNA repair protein RadC